MINLAPMKISDRIKERIEAAGTNPFASARIAGLNPGTLRSILAGQAQDPGVYKIYAIAKALNTTIEDLIGEDMLTPVGQIGPQTSLPIRYRVGGGAWVENDDYAQDFIGEYEGRPAVQFKNHPQWYEVLDGDSLNRIAPSGTYLHVVDAISLNYKPKQDDIVIVERTRSSGFLRERSAKQINFGADGIELWPRSFNPRWQKPIPLNDHQDDESVTVEIKGLVIKAVIDAKNLRETAHGSSV